MKFKPKPWITLGLQKSISVKNKLLTNFNTNSKKCRILLSTLMKKSKQAYYDKYFEKNWNNIKKTCKGIKSLIYLNTKAPSEPAVLSLVFFQSIFQMKVVVQYFCNLLIKEK